MLSQLACMHDQQKMASPSYSEQDILQKYRDSFYNNKKDLINTLRTGFWKVPLVNSGCLTEEEWGTVEEKSSSANGKDKRTNRATAIIDLVKQKDSFSCYRAFSRVFIDKNKSVGLRIFPFVQELQEAGLHVPLRPTRPVTEGPVRPLDSTPTIVWALSNERECEAVTREMKLTNGSVANRAGFRCQEFPINSASLCVVCPSTPYDGNNPFKSLLSSLRPQLAVMTSTCQPVRGNTTFTANQLVLMTRKEPDNISGEVAFMCELWRLQNKTPLPVVLGRATKLEDDNNPSFVRCRDAVDFYNAAVKVDNLEYFALLEVEGQSGHTAISGDVLQLMSELVTYFSDDRI